MDMTAGTPAQARRDKLVERLFGAMLGMIDAQMTYVGDRLGLYRALAARDATATELATATACDARYVREWLEQQAVAGILEVDDVKVAPLARRYHLPEPYVEVFTDPDSLNYLATFARMMVGVARQLPAVLNAFRTGGGVPYADYDLDFCEGQADMNRTMFVNLLASEWLPAIPDVHERLLTSPPARIADVACGTGYSTLALARAYPNVSVDGIDLDQVSIKLARENLAAAGLADRVTFDVRDAADPGLRGHYDLVTVFEAIHDMSQPVKALRGIRGLLADGACAVIADERVADTFTAPGDEVERLMYGYSVLACLPMGMAERPSAMTGTAMRPETLRDYARQAGFREVRVLPIENEFWRFYRLNP
jgi:2-polyprenyl-3-methyl-5-hydroxy-6-metoxy-1,4-benzoquinol methylase